MSTESPRSFIVGPSGDDAIIREVADGQPHLDRPTAWARGLRMAWPVKSGRVKGVGSVFFMGLDGDRREVATPGDVQAHWLANRLNNPQPDHRAMVATAKTTAEHAAEVVAENTPSPERIAAVVTALKAQQPNDFRDSLLSQFDRKGRLSLKQVEAVERGIAKRAAAKASGPIPEVPAGRYAVENEAGKLAFYRVDRPEDGKWAGYTFVKVMASDEEHRVPMNAAKSILAKIQKDPRAAAVRYGHELGQCGRCGRTLTDEASRAAGIGPICAEKVGW